MFREFGYPICGVFWLLGVIGLVSIIKSGSEFEAVATCAFFLAAIATKYVFSSK